MTYDQKFMTTAEGKTVRFFDTSTLKMIKEQQLTHNAEAASFCPSRMRFVAGGEDMWVHLYDFVSGQVWICRRGWARHAKMRTGGGIHSQASAEVLPLMAFFFSPCLLQELEVNKGHHGPVHSLRFSPTYEAYASGSEDGTIRIWSLDAAGATTGSNGQAVNGAGTA